ncbi:hypothetical protein Lser_V15G44236 [Lactuca serriola]
MGRWKVPMEHINNSKKRNLTFQTRKNGIIKKALELSTLCDVNVSMIIRTDHQEPEIFPPDPHKFTSLTELYKRNRIMDAGKIRYYTLADFFKEKTMKVEEELAMAKKKNLEAKYPTWFDFLNNYKEVELRELALKLESKINDLKNKVESLKDISKIHNQDNYTIYPTTTTEVNADSSSMMPSSNLCGGDYDDLSLDHEEFIGDENNDCYPQENFTLPPYFSPEKLERHEPTSGDEPNKLIMQASNPYSMMKLPSSEDYNYYYKQNQEHNPIYPTTVPNVQISTIMPPLNHCPRAEELGFDPIEPLYDQNSGNYHHENMSFQPSFSPESLMPPFNHCPRDDDELRFDPTQLLNELGFSPDILSLYSDQNNMIMHPSELDSIMKLITSEDDSDHCDHESFNLQND